MKLLQILEQGHQEQEGKEMLAQEAEEEAVFAKVEEPIMVIKDGGGADSHSRLKEPCSSGSCITSVTCTIPSIGFHNTSKSNWTEKVGFLIYLYNA